MPTAFISYSWDSEAHREWVGQFAKDLRAHGVDAWLDRWEVRLGDDITQFMERGVSEADFVLLVCTEAFGAKANARTSGVGYEQAIVTADLLQSQPSRGRFVCIVRSGKPSLAIPRYMQSRLWVDLRADQGYERGFDQLLVHLFQRYDDRKPPLLTEGTKAAVVHDGPSSPPPVALQRWVLVAGTGIAKEFTSELAEVSRYLGSSLGTKGYGAVTGGWPGVDDTVARAFFEATRQLGIPLEDRLVQVVVKSDEPAFAAGQLVFVHRGEEEWREPIRRADAVLLLGGLGGTWTTGQIALEMRRPVLPLADTGGDAKKLYLHMLKTWKEFAWMHLNQTEFQRLARPGACGVDAAMDLLAKVAASGGAV